MCRGFGDHRTFWMALCVLWLPLWVLGQDQESVRLSPKWPLGKRVVQEVKTVSEMGVPMGGGQEVKQVIRQRAEIGLTALAQDEMGGTVLEYEYLALDVEMESRGRTERYSSREESTGTTGNALGRTFGLLVGVKLRVTFDKDGRVVRVEGAKEMLDRTLPDAPPQVRAMMESSFSEDALKKMIEQSLGFAYANRELRVGESFHNEMTMNFPMVGDMRLSMDTTFVGWEEKNGRRQARLAVKGLISQKAEDGAGMFRVQLTDGSMEGVSWYDARLGLSTDSEIVQRYTVKLEAPTVVGAAPSGPSSMSAKVDLKSALLRVEDVKGAGSAGAGTPVSGAAVTPGAR